MVEMYPDRLLQTITDPSAEGAYAAAWALDCEDGNEPQVRMLGGLEMLPRRPLLEDELFLWFGVPGAGSWEEFLPYLPDSDQKEILRLRQPRDRWGVAAARASLRSLLAFTLGCFPCEVEFIRGIHGKPMLDPARHGNHGRHIHFNISHTRGLIAIALAGRATGVDVEAACRIEDMLGAAEIAFAAESLAALLDAPNEVDRTALFFRFWTLGEAFIKATGEGFTQDLKGFAFSANGRPHLTRVDGKWAPASRWRFGILPIDAWSTGGTRRP